MNRLREEHRNIAKILKALEHQVTIFDAAERPDYDMLRAIADYFTGFPDSIHHPKEDLIFRKLREKHAAGADTLVDLNAEHENLSVLAHNFQQAVQNVLLEFDVSRDAFTEVANHFIREQRDHMRMEEEVFFPWALRVLTPKDWADIDVSVTSEKDPVFGTEVAQKFEGLRNAILDWEQENNARGQ